MVELKMKGLGGLLFVSSHICQKGGLAELNAIRYSQLAVSNLIHQKFSSPEESRLWAQFIAFAPFVFQAAKSLRNFGILEFLLDSGCAKKDDLLEASGLSPYGLDVLLDAGVSCGLIFQEGEFFQIAPAGKCIASDELTKVNMNFTGDVCYQGLSSLEDSLRSGRPEGLRAFGEWNTIYEGLTKLPDPALKSWLAFDHYFSDDAFPRALPILMKDRPVKILDVGGNTGKFAITCAAHYPHVSVTILDHEEQLRLAGEHARERGLTDRISGIPMDLLDHSQAFPKGHDAIWMSQFLDCFSREDILQILRRARAAMSADSRLFIMEPFLDRQRYEAARFCLDMTSLYFTCMANGRSRMYRAEEFHIILEQVGLEVEQEFNNIRLSQTILKCRVRVG